MIRQRTLWLAIIILCVWNIVLSVILYEDSKEGTQGVINNTTVIENEVNGFSTDLTKIVKTAKASTVTIDIGLMQGTGVIVRQDGQKVYIATSYHIVENATMIQVTLDNYLAVNATMIGHDPVCDVAVLLIEVDYQTTPITFGDSALLQDGEFVLAIGSPLGIDYRGSLSFGIVSSKDRILDLIVADHSYFIQMIQSDIRLNSGNSGGPLLNMAGELVGLNTLVVKSDDAGGLSFSLTANELAHIVDSLIANGEVVKRDLGISVVALKEMANYQKSTLGIDLSQTSGLYVSDMKSDFIGTNIGIHIGDVIISINDIPMSTLEDLIDQEYLSTDVMRLEILRDGQIIELEGSFVNEDDQVDSGR